MPAWKLPVNYDDLFAWERRQVREQYVLLQDNKCFYCGEPLGGEPRRDIRDAYIKWQLFPSGFKNHPIHLQHDHGTGMTEGAVHMRCNAYMWQYEGR
jgi:hypothetical protein